MNRPLLPLGGNRVVAAPLIDPASHRIDMTLASGLTLAEIVEVTLPGLSPASRARCRVTLTSRSGSAVVSPERWKLVRPKEGVTIVIRVVPGKDALKSVLQIVVTIAAVALGQFWLGPLISSTLGLSSQFANALATSALLTAGSLALSALFPAQKPDNKKEKPSYLISGWQNQLTPDGYVSAILGRMRYAPPYAMISYTEVVGDELYLRALFCFGYGPIAFSNPKIGDTPVDKYRNVTIEWRQGFEDDEPVTLTPRQVIEEQFGAELTRGPELDDAGQPVEPKNYPEAPVSRFTAPDTSEISIILGFPAGLIGFTDKGNKKHRSIDVRIRARKNGKGDFTEIATLNINAKKTEAIYRQFTWTPASRGLWEVEVTRITNDSTSTQVSDRCVWYAMQSIRPEYPINFDRPLALAAVRVKATHQLNGTLDNFNAVCTRIAPDWDADSGTWIERETQWPPSLYRYILQGPATTYPAADAEIDLDALADWHDYCVEHGLRYNRAHDFEGSKLDQMIAVAAAGNASPRHDGTEWGVVIDRPQASPVDHFTQRNMRQFRWQRNYFTPPDAFRISFNDQTNDYGSAERLVWWPADLRHETRAALDADADHTDGTTGEVWNDATAADIGPYVMTDGAWVKKALEVTEQLDAPGLTDPDQVWLFGRRRCHELINRPDTFTGVQDAALTVATRGDWVAGSWDVLSSVQRAVGVKTVRGDLVEVDEAVTIEEGKSYACRWRIFADEDDAVGESIMRAVATDPGERRLLRLTGAPLDVRPSAGDILMFGPAGAESMQLVVRATEAGDDNSTVFHMMAAAPEIAEALEVDAAAIPPWNGRVGQVVAIAGAVPAVPKIVSIDSGFTGTDETGGLTLLMEPGDGSAAVIQKYEVLTRIAGATEWTGPAIGYVADGGVDVAGYARGDVVELKARAVSIDGAEGDYTPIVTVTIGSDDASPAGALAVATLTAGLGCMTIDFATTAGTASLRIYRQAGWGGELDREADFVQEVQTPAVSTYTAIDGDATRVNLLGPTWTEGAGWSVTGEEATHTAGSLTQLLQAVSLTAGNYRAGMNVEAISGSGAWVRMRFHTGTVANGPTETTTGQKLATLVSDGTQPYFGVQASDTADVTAINIVLFRETAACLPQGKATWWLETFNDDGEAGVLAGPFERTII